MKPTRWFTRSNSVRSYLRLATAGTLISAAAAMAFVAANSSSPANNPSPLLSGKSAGKGEAKLEKRSVRNKAFASHFKTLLGRAKSSGEGSPIDGLAQEAYDNRAYPSMWIGPAQRHAARAAANAILTGARTIASPLA
jgi:ribosomal protein S20